MPLRAQMKEEAGVNIARLPIWKHHSHSRKIQECLQESFIQRLTTASQKAGFKFGECNERNPDLNGTLDED